VIVDPAGILALTSLGEQALRDWEAKTKGLRTNSTAYPADSRTSRDVEVVAGLAAYGEGVSKGSFDEALRLVTRAKQMLSSGDELRAVGVAYRAAVIALKQLTGLEKGHLTDLAEKASDKGLLNIAEDEVRRLYAANIESKRLLKQASEGLQLSAEDRKRMADAAELLASLAERVAALGEGGVE
jgi:HEPN domain-containing protein